MPSSDPAVKKSISLSESLFRGAHVRMKERNISGFSDYIQQLIREDMEVTNQKVIDPFTHAYRVAESPNRSRKKGKGSSYT